MDIGDGSVLEFLKSTASEPKNKPNNNNNPTAGYKLFAEFSQLIENEYGFEKKLISSQNSQANYILDHIHQTICNMICKFEVHNNTLDEDDALSGSIAAIAIST